MPFISFTTNHKLTLKQENTIKEETGKLISLLPGKSEKSLMLHMKDDQIMYFKGEEVLCMMISVNIYHTINSEHKKTFVEALCKMIHETTKIEIENIYVRFDEYPEWGMNGTLI